MSDGGLNTSDSSATIAHVGLGSNVGDRLAHLQRALESLARLNGVELVAASRVYESEPAGGPPGQERYFNAVVRLRTALNAVGLLRRLHEIEDELGRLRTVRWGPRTIDLDLLLFGDAVIQTDDVRVPHPHLPERPFVLAPLADLDPDLREPKSGRPVRELLAACPHSDCRVAADQTLSVPRGTAAT